MESKGHSAANTIILKKGTDKIGIVSLGSEKNIRKIFGDHIATALYAIEEENPGFPGELLLELHRDIYPKIDQRILKNVNNITFFGEKRKNKDQFLFSVHIDSEKKATYHFSPAALAKSFDVPIEQIFKPKEIIDDI